jgi:hypothetical protein
MIGWRYLCTIKPNDGGWTLECTAHGPFGQAVHMMRRVDTVLEAAGLMREWIVETSAQIDGHHTA